MQHVSSHGGPRILLPTQEVDHWVNELHNASMTDGGLYDLACSVEDYCGIIRPWGTPLLVLGDDPADVYWLPLESGGLLFRWVAADSLAQLAAFAKSVAEIDEWTEAIEWEAECTDYTLMDTCTFMGDKSPRVSLTIAPGKYVVESQYAESARVLSIVHSLRFAS